MSIQLRPVFMIAACILLLVTPGESQDTPSAAEDTQKFVKVVEGVYAAFPNPKAMHTVTSGFVIGKEAVWVFDAQRRPFPTQLQSEIRKLTSLPVKYLILSHHHSELVDGVPAFENVTIVAHSGMRKNLIEEPRPGVRLPDIIYEDQLTFYDVDRELQLIHLGRYHTDGDSVLFLPREKVLFSGDLLPGKRGPGGMRQAYLRDFVKSIDKALALDFDTIIPGRGVELATKDDLRKFQQYLVQVVNSVQEFVDRGATLQEAKAKVPVPDYIDPARRGTEVFERLWERTIERVYAEMTGKTKP